VIAVPIARDVLEENLRRVYGARRPDLAVRVESFAPGRFTLSFPDRPMGEGECIDADFTEIQFALHEHAKIDTGIQGGRRDEDDGRYHIEYAVIEWDD
jgi:hypothetical protein